MKKYLQIILSDGLIYGIAAVVTKVVHIFLVPLYSAQLSPMEYGHFGLLNSVLVITTILIFFGMESAIGMWYYRSEDEIEKQKVFGNWIYFMWALSIVISLSVFLLRRPLAEIILGNTELASYFSLIALNNLFFGLQYIVVVYFRYRREPIRAVLVALVLTMLTLGANYFFVKIQLLGVQGILYSNILVSIVFFTIGLACLRKTIRPANVDFDLMGSMVKFSLPLVPSAILRFALLYSLIYLIQYFATTVEVGIYQVGSTISGIVHLFVMAFMIPWNTIWYSISEEPNAGQIYNTMLLLFCGSGILIAILISLLAPEIVQLFSSATYAASASVIGLLAINHIILGMAQITLVGAALKLNNRPYLYAMIGGVCTALVLVPILLESYGLRGACYGLLVGSLVVQVIILYHSQRLNAMPYSFGSIGIILFGGLVVEYIGFEYVSGLLARLACVSVLITLFGVFLWNRRKGISLLIQKS